MEFSVHKFRASKKLKQSELGEILGVKQSYVSDIEVGRKKMPQELIDKLAEKFGDMSEFYEAKSENEDSSLSLALEIITKQIEIIRMKEEQNNRLILLLENQLNKNQLK